ncbi:hypothetical protein SAMN02745163_01387 [Clostridium cavendishii DSM 21758]|uniref:PD-(D/E)XK nuclease superfamily protein n=1 Tax=Clostridium cavendishii DSM 21758 TaxID=1121302 RepID=A0A1M6GU41_9CLOT|nr:hypothetical protein [Clostridium cavendishii]SHJ13442.1 hypothetical protein SAMN02745163_01387 [Clostridium cavendishii DSM 21758]
MYIDDFFNYACEAIKEEEDILNQLFEKNQKLYKKEHNGICIMYETTYVYIIFKKLLSKSFDLRVSWEEPYPNARYLHSDIGLFRDNDLVALIEFKIWVQNNDNNIKADIAKLKGVKGIDKYIFIITYGGEHKANIKYLMESNKNEVTIIRTNTDIKTKFFYCKEQRFIDNNITILLMKVKEQEDV